MIEDTIESGGIVWYPQSFFGSGDAARFATVTKSGVHEVVNDLGGRWHGLSYKFNENGLLDIDKNHGIFRGAQNEALSHYADFVREHEHNTKEA